MKSKLSRDVEILEVKNAIHIPQEDKKEIFAYHWRVIVGDEFPYQSEYNFDAPRKHRFDFAWPERKIAVEVDGNAWHVKGGGRHGTDKDREKINIAAQMGWRIFHFSPTMLDGDPYRWIHMVRGCLI
jgi:very-short-patch-repair endonuclease